MQPQVWMRHPEFLKVRKALASWNRNDFLDFAYNLFSNEDIEFDQLVAMVTLLKKPGVKPPQNVKRVQQKIVFRSNKSAQYTGDVHRLFLSAKQVKIHFATKESFLAWACELVRCTGQSWEKAYDQFKRENLSLIAVHQALSTGKSFQELLLLTGEIKVDHQLVRYLQNQEVKWSRLTQAYPDNTPLKRVYYSLSKEDKLVDKEGEIWRVSHVKQKLEQPPEITIEKVVE